MTGQAERTDEGRRSNFATFDFELNKIIMNVK
jgi:hypothetical protein